MLKICVRTLFATLMILAGATVAAGAAPYSYDLPGHGALNLLVPDGWIGQVKQPPNRLPPTISLKPQSGEPFEILVTAIWPIGTVSKLPDEAAVRSEIAAAAADALSQSVERQLPVQEIKGAQGGGFYFASTDRAPKAGEFKYLTQGAIRVGALLLSFTVLTNDGQESVVQSALEMLRTAEHRED